MGHIARYATALLGSVALGVLGAGAAHAQQAQNTNTKYVTLLERLVIGSGAPKVAIDTPQAVTVIDQADIDAKQATTIGEVLDDTPGVTMIGSERAFGESFNIRGVGAAETSGDKSRIIIRVDGAEKFYEQYRMGSFFSDPELYKQIEVLRGPASSTLYGSGAFGGVVNFTTKDAADFIQDGKTGALRLKTTYGTNGNAALVSGILAHRISETFEILATGNFRRSDAAQLANGGTLKSSEFSAWSGLIKGTIHLDAEQVVRISHQRWSSDAKDQDYAQTGTVTPTPQPPNFGKVDRAVADQSTVLSYENPASDDPMLDLKVQLSYSDTAVSQRNITSTDAASIGPADYGYQTVQLNAQNTSELSGDNWINFVTYGVQASHEYRTAALTNGSIISTHPEGHTTALGIFAQTEHTIDDRFTVTVGARADYANLSPSPALTPQLPASNQFAFSPKVAALYKFNENFNVFGSVAHTERLPTLDEMYQYSGASRPGNPNLKKETANNFELGFATQGFDMVTDGDSAAVKVTGFYNDITDGIRVNNVAANAPYFANVASMRLYGLEIEGSYEAEMVFARLAYTLTRGDYTKTFIGSGGSATTNAGNTRYVGDPVDTLPQDKIVLTVGGRLPDQYFEYGTKITLAADPIVAVVTSPATAKPTGWASVDVFASWKPKDGVFAGTEAQFSVENIFNTDYRENLSMDRSKGRTFKLTLAKQFDY